MGELLTRRRDIVFSSSPAPTPGPSLVYELASPTSASQYDTNVLLFDTPKDFTILCESSCSNRNWYNSSVANSGSMFGIGTGVTFRVGAATGYNYYEQNVKTGTNKSPYTALVFNNNSADSDPKKCCSIFARDSSTTKTTKYVVVRYTASSCKAEVFCSRDSSYYAPNVYWWNLSQTPSYPTTTLKLNWNTGTSCEIRVFKVYFGLLTDSEINSFLGGS